MRYRCGWTRRSQEYRTAPAGLAVKAPFLMKVVLMPAFTYRFSPTQ